MNDRRAFLRELGALTILALRTAPALHSSPSASPAMAAATPGKNGEPLGWKPHVMKQGDGRGGWIVRAAEYQLLHHKPVPGTYNKSQYVKPFGVAQMDNGEVLFLGSWHSGEAGTNFAGPVAAEKPVVIFSRDRGNTWTEFERIEGGEGRPVMLAYLGKGNLMFQTDLVKPIMQYFSSDYGRTWPERQPLQLAPNGGPFHGEGNPLVDRDAKAGATRIAAVGWNFGTGRWPDPQFCFLRWSHDGGRTWTKETLPKAWRWQEEYEGKSYLRSVGEGSLVRAANGWLVAALRTGLPPRFLPTKNDSLCGTGVSISKDEGATWSPVRVLYEAGRHHAHLLRLASGDIVMTLIVRDDVQNSKLASYRRGLEAILSHDNGLTWDVAHKYILDDFEFYDGVEWYNGETGHLYSTLLDDGSILTGYGNYLTNGASLIRWKPSPL